MTVQNLLNTLKDKKSIQIRGINKNVVGLAKYSTMNNPDAEYVKVAFSDGSGMYFPTDEEVVFYFDRKLGTALGIDDSEVSGTSQKITWNNVDFSLVNGNDYQFVKELYIGNIHQIEGEVRFSDYENTDGSVLSLGWNMFDNKRDDVYASPLVLDELE